MQLFIDESGDLGGAKSSKRYFVVAGVMCEEEEVSHTMKSLLHEFGLPELKFKGSPTMKRRSFFPSLQHLISA